MSNIPEKLLAKSRQNGKEITLQSHLFETEQAAQEVFHLEKRWGRNWCRFFKIYEKAEQEKFLLNLRIAALFHDIGKANEDFQKAVSQQGFYQQTIRHEHFSALILHLPEVRKWLAENKNLDLEIITAAVLSHHIKASGNPKNEWFWMQAKNEKSIIYLYDFHDEINKVFDDIQCIAQLTKPLRLNYQKWEKDSQIWKTAKTNGRDTAEKFDTDLLDNLNRNYLLLAVKAGLVAADAVASGLVRIGLLESNFTKWIKEKSEREKFTKDEVSEKILIPKAMAILKSEKKAKQRELVENAIANGIDLNTALGEHLWNDFQKESATLGERALLLAACGSGKTIAAWKWAEAQVSNPDREIGKVIFLYPTRGTATEGFKDYVAYAPADEASLNHGQSEYELKGIKENPQDSTKDKDYQDETSARLYALGFWGKRYFSATVDQFLSFMENSYTSLCLLPVLADSAVIIDEVHSFDKRMFENLVCFLKNFDVPVLCMTATLPKSRIENLEKEGGLRVYPNKVEFEKLEDLKKAENHERYNLEIIENADYQAREDKAFYIAIKEYEAGNRVLWVVNTVARCQKIAKRIKESGIKPKVYHSRFRLEDRKKRHEETVKAFQQIEAAQIAVTTQVCEMSLDLDADVLITEVAPIPSLVQRFGRSNRHLERGEKFRSCLVVYMSESDKPYSQKDDLEPALNFLKDLPTKDISQWLLAEKLREHVKRERKTEGEFAPFLSGGYYATKGNFRDIDDFTNPCILSGEDLEKVKECIENKKPLDDYIVSVPRGKNRDETPIWIIDEKPSWFSKNLKYLNIADSKFYRKNYGFITDLDLLDGLEDEND